MALEVGTVDRLILNGVLSGSATKNALYLNPGNTTMTDSAAVRYSTMFIESNTCVLPGQTQITTLNQGMVLRLGGTTINQTGGAVTIDQASCFHVGSISPGASVTITANRMISTAISDCYLTNAGVWTDTASTEKVKHSIEDLDRDHMIGLIEQIKPRQYRYNGHFNNCLLYTSPSPRD